MSKVLTPQALKCPVTGKSAYTTEARAMAIAERSNVDPKWRNDHGAPAREAYHCRHCNWWHLSKGRNRSGVSRDPHHGLLNGMEG